MVAFRAAFNPALPSRLALLTMLAMAMTACTTAPGGPANIWLGQLSNGTQQTQTVAVKSWKDMKFDNLVRQQTDFSCGAAVLATIFNYAYDRRTTERQVLVNMLKIADPDLVREKGFSLLDMKNYAQAVGMKGEGYRIDYATLMSLKVPAIALINLGGYKHFVIIRKARPNDIAIGDPALGNRTMSRPAFEKAWNKVAFVIVGEGYDPQTVLLDPPAPLSAQRLYELRSPVPNADPSEFGFGPAFNFTL